MASRTAKNKMLEQNAFDVQSAATVDRWHI